MTFFEDEWRSPILVSDLAAALLELTGLEVAGILHVAGAEPVNRYGLACMIAAAHGLPSEHLRRGSVAESSIERAAHCVLDSSRARGLLRTPLPAVLDRIGSTWKSGSGG
jgi:dTDP-4-dehydrorhamnose reductase